MTIASARVRRDRGACQFVVVTRARWRERERKKRKRQPEVTHGEKSTAVLCVCECLCSTARLYLVRGNGGVRVRAIRTAGVGVKNTQLISVRWATPAFRMLHSICFSEYNIFLVGAPVILGLQYQIFICLIYPGTSERRDKSPLQHPPFLCRFD